MAQVQKLFEVATKRKLRFNFKGNLSVEDLWDLRVEDLDIIFKQLNSKKKQASEESLLEFQSQEDFILETKINIVKHIVAEKLAESRRIEESLKQKEKNKRILEVLHKKQDEELQNLSIEELQNLLNKSEI